MSDIKRRQYIALMRLISRSGDTHIRIGPATFGRILFEASMNVPFDVEVSREIDAVALEALVRLGRWA